VGELSDDTVAEAQRGDGAAFREIYLALAPAVAGYLRSHGSADPDALTSEVFLTVHRRLPELTGGAKGLRTFVFSVAHARMVDEARARARGPQVVEYDPADDPRFDPSAEDEAVVSLGAQSAIEMLSHLVESQREVLTLRVVAGLTLEETAQATGRTVGAVKQLQRRGLVALRAQVVERGVTL
jgi:RNA polymerase sigma-70 factor (ECF subfamily)